MAAKPLTDIQARQIITQRLLRKGFFVIGKRRSIGRTYSMNEQLKKLKKLGKNILLIK